MFGSLWGVWIWPDPLLPCSWPLPSIQTQQPGRCTLSRTPYCTFVPESSTHYASMLHVVEWICLIFD
ncbi:hypothetical protein PAHAL_3G306800 [Panicum hallii]|uniref:Uncharacterized protein n=1 Tax=Panicum hallii TaxID=206008 RepID=A0A2T8KJZ0_9POAL|nr:hypothetical protein PAHAL_3G306800 [Panicum hallii]